MNVGFGCDAESEAESFLFYRHTEPIVPWNRSRVYDFAMPLVEAC
jgi:hypothetical protein